MHRCAQIHLVPRHMGRVVPRTQIVICCFILVTGRAHGSWPLQHLILQNLLQRSLCLALRLGQHIPRHGRVLPARRLANPSHFQLEILVFIVIMHQMNTISARPTITYILAISSTPS